MDENQIEIRAVIHFLHMKGFNPPEIHKEVCDTYGDKAVTLRTVQGRVKMIKEDSHSIFDHHRKGRPEKEELIPKIQDILKQQPYISTRKLAKLVKADKKTIKSILVKKLSMSKVNFKWVPYELTPEIREQRVEKATKLHNFLTSANKTKLSKVLTQDETWIYFENNRNTMWISEGMKIPTKKKQTIGALKVMLSVTWSMTGIKSITLLPMGQKFNKTFFEERVLGDLAQKLKTNGYFFHTDNARPHLANKKFNELGLKRLDHPPYSPDIAPSDFFLFGYLKMLLEGVVFLDEKDVFDRVSYLLYSIPKYYFFNAYEEWIKRLALVIETNGEYVQ